MKLIHIVSSVALFCLPALAANDWDCGEVVIHASPLEVLMQDVADKRERTDEGSFTDFPPDHFFRVERYGDDLGLPRAQFQIEFNNLYQIRFVAMKVDNEYFKCHEKQTRN
ncbi:BgtE-20004 [Blumeria graminis f. sp. tritici]|uniref:BgtE-20004 n=2 Tax=Blumeria graminis f. sp. tritici TaxID=62690 RepID=A0A381L0M8_BLUGR|nr:BgtE-20004 [Blumeria graminis f. sp. tritici]